MRFVHLGVDDKFIDFFYQTCDRIFPGENEFLVVSGDETLKYVRHAHLVRRVESKFLVSLAMQDILRNCQVLIIHYLTVDAIKLLSVVPKNIIVAWSGWGGDYYLRMPQFSVWGYGERTRSILDQLYPQQKSSVILRSILNCKDYWYRKRLEIKAISRVDFFSSPLPEDYELVKSAFPYFNGQYLQLNYGSVEELFQVGPKEVSGHNILLGNSADPTNNHVEVFDILRHLDLSGRKVFVPLSYGDTRYRECIISEGNALLGECFQPLVDFMPIEEYINIIATCGTVIMNHRRQQAMGNIGIMMYKGAKLFLNHNGVAYDFFSKRGGHIFDVESIHSGDESIFQTLTQTQIFDNRKILELFWARDIVQENFKKLGLIGERKRKLGN